MSSVCKIPIVIIKKDFQRKKNKSGGFNFCCCIDGSKKSYETFQHAKSLATGEKDRIYALTCMHDPQFTFETDVFKDMTTKSCEKYDVKVTEHLFCSKDEGTNLEETLSNFVNFHETIAFDYIIVS